MAEPTTAYIGLGSNLGDRHRNIREALKTLDHNAAIEVGRVSDIKETAPLGQVSEPYYLNAVAELKTTLDPERLLSVLMTTEEVLGRTRRSKWGPRTIDLDLLLFGSEVIRLPDLIVPHPQMHLRLSFSTGCVSWTATCGIRCSTNRYGNWLAVLVGATSYSIRPARNSSVSPA